MELRLRKLPYNGYIIDIGSGRGLYFDEQGKLQTDALWTLLSAYPWIREHLTKKDI